MNKTFFIPQGCVTYYNKIENKFEHFSSTNPLIININSILKFDLNFYNSPNDDYFYKINLINGDFIQLNSAQLESLLKYANIWSEIPDNIKQNLFS